MIPHCFLLDGDFLHDWFSGAILSIASPLRYSGYSLPKMLRVSFIRIAKKGKNTPTFARDAPCGGGVDPILAVDDRKARVRPKTGPLVAKTEGLTEDACSKAHSAEGWTFPCACDTVRK
jgi:hypothetical protein